MRILFIGDIFGRPGRTIVRERLDGLVKEHQADLIIANGENSAAGFGITPQLAEELFDLGIDVITRAIMFGTSGRLSSISKQPMEIHTVLRGGYCVRQIIRLACRARGSTKAVREMYLTR